MGISENLKIAVEAANRASSLLRKNFDSSSHIKVKNFYDDIITTADTETDKLITRILKKKTPNYNLLSEESGFTDNKSEYTWVIDPLDGSANYANHIPYFGCSVGLARKGLPVIGVVCDPINGNIIYAEEGRGAFFNSKIINIVEKELRSSILGFDYGRTLKDEMNKIIGKFINDCRYVRVAGSSVLGFRDVAINRTQAYVHNDLKAWDACAGAIIIKEAGGKVTNFDGENWSIKDRNVIASSFQSFPKLFKVIQDL